MKNLVNLFFSFLLMSCSILDKKNIAPGYQEAYKAITNYFLADEDALITPELISTIPYASASLRIGRGSAGLVILESINDNQTTWVSADGVYITLNESGRIIRTIGLPNNLHSVVANKDLLSQNNLVVTNYYSYDSPKLNFLPIRSSFRVKEKSKVEILNQTLNVTLIEEKISNDYLGWKAVNKFWIDENNFTLKSEQNISPKLPTFYLTITKKPAN